MRSRKFLKAEQATLAWDAPGLMAGVDEAGRGPLAGPVVAAAVILDDQRPIRGLADSKTLTALQRERLNDQILAKALCCSVAQASVDEIDTHNILQATMLAMRRAVEGLRLKPVKVLVDGNRLPDARRAGRGHHRRRCTREGDLGRVDPGQGAPRPAVPGTARRISALWLRRPQGLRHARTPGGAAAPRRLRAPPAILQPGRRGACTWDGADGARDGGDVERMVVEAAQLEVRIAR